MTQDTRILTAIDIGTTKVCTIIGKKSDSDALQIAGYGVVPCQGLAKGNIEDVAATRQAVGESVQRAERMAGVKVMSAYVGVNGSHVSFENRRDTLDWIGKHGVITADDIVHVPETVASYSKAFDRKVIHAIPISYSLDGKEGIKDPMGMHTRHLEVETHLVTGASSELDRLTAAVERAGVKVEGLVLGALASSEAVLTAEEMTRGAALIDLGGGTTKVVVFKSGSVYYSSVIPIGGFQFTNDICLTYNTPFDAAEEAKLTHSHTEPDTVRPHEEITLPVMGRSTGLKVPRRDLCQLTRERAMELMRLIMLKLKEADISDINSCRLVLTGGASGLTGMEDMIKRTLTSNVRIGVPADQPGIPEELRAPAFSTGIGVLLWARNQQASNNNGTHGMNGNGVVAKEREPVNTGGRSRRFNPFRRSKAG